MTADRHQNDTPKDPYSKIDELEHQVRELSGLVERLMQDRVQDAPSESAEPAASSEEVAEHPDQLILEMEPEEDETVGVGTMLDTFALRVGQALGGEEGESLEARIGGIWLTRVSAVLVMTVLALGSPMILREQGLEPLHKIAIGYGMAAIGIFVGLSARSRNDLFATTLLGCGLAALYFTTYGAFFIEQTQLFDSPRLGVAVLAAALAGVVGVIHFTRSQSASGIALFLIYYTVVLSMRGNPSLENVLYAFCTCAALAVVALLFHLTHRWLLFTWGALIATHITYLFFFEAKPPALDISDVGYFWLSNGFLGFIYVLFSVACVTDARRTGEYRRTVGPMCGVNSFVFLVVTWFSIRDFYPEYEWAFRAAFCVMMLVFALYANNTGPRYNYLFQIFVAKSFIMLTLSLQAFLSHEWLLVAMALECLGLAFSYYRAGLVIFKLLGIGLLGLTFVGALISVRIPGSVDLLAYRVPANWFVCVGTPLVLTIVAWFYERFTTRTPPEQRIVKGQWFLADTIFDFRSSTMAMWHASAAALILMVITIIDLSDSASLPYILAAESVALMVWGLILRTPQIDVAGVLLLAAAHVTYHTYMLMGGQSFVFAERYVVYTTLIASLTYVGGLLWERYLLRLKSGTLLEHELLASIPYLAATMMLVSLVMRELSPQYAAPILCALGTGMMLTGGLAHLSGVRGSAILAIGLGTAAFYKGMYTFENPLALAPHFLPALAALLIMYAIAERLIQRWEYTDHHMYHATPEVLRGILVTLAAVMGVLGLWEWAPPEQLTFYLSGLAVGFVLVGAAVSESRYRWAFMGIIAVALLRAYFYDLTRLPPLIRLLSFGGMCIALMIISMGYARYRTRELKRLQLARQEQQV